MAPPKQEQLFDTPSWIDDKYYNDGKKIIVGVDEVGRGPLAGPVVASAVCLPQHIFFDGITDSKKLSHKKRLVLFEKIHEKAIAIGVGAVSPPEIDDLNILQASLKAMSLAYSQLLRQLQNKPDLVLVDGKQVFSCKEFTKPVIKGDSKSRNIAAASIVAKVLRDEHMDAMDRLYPNYGFASNKGYPSQQHREALKTFGPTPIHRLSFKGVLQEEKSPSKEKEPEQQPGLPF